MTKLKADTIYSELQSAIDEARADLVVGKEPYGFHYLYEPAERQAHLRSGSVIFAEDACGNWFSESASGALLFIDHETDEAELLVEDLTSIAGALIRWDSPDSEEGQVVSAWIDPEFLQKVRRDDV